MRRHWIWLQLLIGWTPIWALFVMLVLTAHPGIGVLSAVFLGLRMIAAAAVLGLGVERLTMRLPWPHPMRPSFVAAHLVSAALYSVTWFLLNSLIESIRIRSMVLVLGPGFGPFLVTGVWLYIMVAGVYYANQAAERAARIEAIAVRSQLAALRAQLNPHFLFNALHTVVQLIPREPRRAAHAAEQIATLLRTTIEENRDMVSLGEEWAFVERYLEIERIRFGDRLKVEAEWGDGARDALLPSFAIQTLVENAVRHGAAPRVEPTTVKVQGRIAGSMLTVTVHDDGAGANPESVAASSGTGLARLRERLAALYGGRARLDVAMRDGGGFTATLTLPHAADGEDAERPAHLRGVRK
jgi:hypothetical protein